MPYIPYCHAPVIYTVATPQGEMPIGSSPIRPRNVPPMLEYLQSPRGLLVLNLARVAYRQARSLGVPHVEALEAADAELAAVSGDPNDGLAEWVAAGNDVLRPITSHRVPANYDQPTSRSAA
jgi:hypothetical protein